MNEVEASEVKTSFIFDFARGDFVVVDGRVRKASGDELIKNKVEKLLRTEYQRYKIYDRYGMQYHNWIYSQRDRELITIALTRELTERIPALVEGVKAVHDVRISFERRALKVTLSISTIFSERSDFETWIQ